MSHPAEPSGPSEPASVPAEPAEADVAEAELPPTPADATDEAADRIGRRNEWLALAALLTAMLVYLAILSVPPERTAVVLQRPPEQAAAYRIDLNAAGVAELQHLPGVGPKVAAAIVARRQSVGAFADVDQLDRVRGIGPKTLARLRPYCTVNPPRRATTPTPTR